jgi:RNA polymerase-interacting CarD/CdnL/TRCF family regulator
MSLWLTKKTVAPTTLIEYLGLTIDTGKMIIKIPENKISELKE